MAHGMRLRHSDGSEMINETDRMASVFATPSYTFSGGATSVDVTVAGVSDTTHFAFDNTNNYLIAVKSGFIRIYRLAGLGTGSGTVTVMRL